LNAFELSKTSAAKKIENLKNTFICRVVPGGNVCREKKIIMQQKIK